MQSALPYQVSLTSIDLPICRCCTFNSALSLRHWTVQNADNRRTKKYGEKEERDRVRQMSRHVAIGDFWCGAPDYSIILQVFNETRRESANAASALVSFRCVWRHSHLGSSSGHSSRVGPLPGPLRQLSMTRIRAGLVWGLPLSNNTLQIFEQYADRRLVSVV